MQAKKPNAAIVALIVIVLVGAGAGAGVYLVQQNQATTTNTQDTSVSTGATPDATTSSASTATYNNGTYTAKGGYISPGGQETVDVQITLSNDTITAATVTPHPASETSTQYQGEFVNHFKDMVIGRNIDQVKLSRVAGSSLTSTGFNDALEQIKTEAAA